MHVSNAGKYEQSLQARAAELRRSLRQRGYISAEQTADELDQTVQAAERDLSAKGLENDFRSLRQIEAALRRIREDEYGACLRCDEPISPKRLDAIPWASFCLSCQERAERMASVEEDDVGAYQAA
jgi:DnaK suppressor protein